MKTEAAATVFEVLDALGLAQLVKRRGDLGGSAPLRAVQGCSPLFEGNAFGFQITLRQRITLRRSPGGVTVEIESPFGETFTMGHRAVLPRLVAQRVLPPDGMLATAFADDFIQVEQTGSGHARVRLWTGLCVRADAGVWLRVCASANRRNRFIEVEEQFITDDGAFAPLVLNMELPLQAPDRVILDGEIATLAPVAPGVRIDEVPLAQAREIGAAHAAFYDETYFEAKHGAVTGKYRKLRPPEEASRDNGPARCRLITVGPPAHTIVGPMPCVVFANHVAFEATYDGYTFAVEPDQNALRAGARAVERTFAEALGPTFLGANSRAMLYFTKYFTHHPPGEPHFFVKPWAFMQTPPGWSCLLEGVHGDGFDVLRGVVATDVFHAMPAVFQVHRAGLPIRVGSGEPLLRVMPIPRRLLEAGFRLALLRG
jgi:hypothetical protein